jgi:RHS repeat-associated protein
MLFERVLLEKQPLLVEKTDFAYRYRFNGMEGDPEVKGEGNSYNFGARMYDARVGRWSKIDNVADSKPHLSPYQSFRGNPNMFIDTDGNDEYLSFRIKDERTGKMNIIRLPSPISDKLQTDGLIMHTGGQACMTKEVAYYDFRTIIDYTIDKNGEGTMTGVNTFILKESSRKKGNTNYDYVFLSGPKAGSIKDPFDYFLFDEGSGGNQYGGIQFNSSIPGASPTKFKSLSGARESEIQELLDAVSALGNGSLGGKYQDMLKDVSGFVGEIAEGLGLEGGDPVKERKYFILNKTTSDEGGTQTETFYFNSEKELLDFCSDAQLVKDDGVNNENLKFYSSDEK